MATAKKSTTKKAPVKKAPAKKASVTKAKATKKTSAKKSAELKSFRLAKNQPPFTSFKITRQTVYWVILVSFIIFAQLWIIKLQVDVANLIEIQQRELLDTTY